MPIFSKDGVDILFIHIPKAAGSSIKAHLRKAGYVMQYNDHGPKMLNSLNHIRKCSPQHMHAEMLECVFATHKIPHIFTIVRNPYTRIRSEYVMRNHRHGFKVNIEKWFDDTISKYETNNYVYDNHIRPQSDFILDGTKVFKYEMGLKEILIEVSKFAGEEIASHAPKHMLNSGEKIDNERQKTLLSKELKSKIREFYKKDFEIFKYIT